ncbi:unnamed protein product [Paramecium primaurelia]|uniref:Uncharacterized protein n=1 Tax=Paramecium primaurelia TaxID=5886 RepID=A0A8S1P8W6_PARPR|nr:unnamed protein product [Paramecium primaurelia]
MESQTTRRMISQESILEPAEFISARTDTKIKLGYLFIQNPNKLEMFGLRQVSSRLPKFKKDKPLIELPQSETSKSLVHKSQSIECKKYNKTLSKLVLNKSYQEQLVLQNPTYVPEDKKEQIKSPQKILQSHHSRQRKELPPILANLNLSPPPFDTIQMKKEKKYKIQGKIYLGRLSKMYCKQRESDNQKQLFDQLSLESPNAKMLMRNQNLKRSKQISLSQAIKVLKKNQQQENRSRLDYLFKSKERELMYLIQGNDDGCQTIDDLI